MRVYMYFAGETDRRRAMEGEVDEPTSRPTYREQNRWPLIAAALLLLLLMPPATIGGFVIWHGTASAIAPSKMARLQVGMRDRDVQDLLGEPDAISDLDDGGKQWVFSRMTWAMYYIEFGPDGRIVRHWHDYWTDRR